MQKGVYIPGLRGLSELLGANLIQSLSTASGMNDAIFDCGLGFVGIYFMVGKVLINYY